MIEIEYKFDRTWRPGRPRPGRARVERRRHAREAATTLACPGFGEAGRGHATRAPARHPWFHVNRSGRGAHGGIARWSRLARRRRAAGRGPWGRETGARFVRLRPLANRCPGAPRRPGERHMLDGGWPGNGVSWLLDEHCSGSQAGRQARDCLSCDVFFFLPPRMCSFGRIFASSTCSGESACLSSLLGHTESSVEI